MTEEKILAWHFTEGRTLRDGQPLEVGKTYTHEGEIKICESGYHASRRLIDALRYAPGAQISRVECWGDVQEQDDKLVARNRTVLWTIDATMILHEFACRVAEIALSKVTNPDPRSLAAIKAKRKWMKGKISDKDLDAAESAAGSAAESTVRRAAWAAARSAAWAAAGSAAWAAAESAAWAAAESAAESAAWAAAESAAGSAARSAVWAAARSAAWSEFDTLLTQMVETKRKYHGKRKTHDGYIEN